MDQLERHIVIIQRREAGITAREHFAMLHYRQPILANVSPHENVTLRYPDLLAVCAMMVRHIVRRKMQFRGGLLHKLAILFLQLGEKYFW